MQHDLLVARIIEIAFVSFYRVLHSLEQGDFEDHVTMLAQHDFELGLVHIAADFFTGQVDADLLGVRGNDTPGGFALVFYGFEDRHANSFLVGECEPGSTTTHGLRAFGKAGLEVGHADRSCANAQGMEFACAVGQ